MKTKTHVKQFNIVENQLCRKLGVDLVELNTKIMEWAEQDSERWAKYEELVRNGERLQELRFFAESLDGPKKDEPETLSGGIFDL